jgi:lysophospholipase
MGGTIAADYALTHQAKLAGLILSGPVLKIEMDVPPILVRLSKLLSFIFPKLPTKAVDARGVSQDPQVVDAYMNDPLVYQGRIRARLGAEWMETIKKVQDRAPEITLPLLVMHGTADPLADAEGSKKLCIGAGSKDKSLHLYDGFYHELFNEPGREQVFSDLEAWLTSHV